MSIREALKEKQARLAQEREQEQRKKEREMMVDAPRWPRWPLLPVKRANPQHPHALPTLGLMFSGDQAEERWVVYEGLNLFGFSTTVVKSATTYGEYFAGAERKHEFESVDSLLDAGWRVD